MTSKFEAVAPVRLLPKTITDQRTRVDVATHSRRARAVAVLFVLTDEQTMFGRDEVHAADARLRA